MKQVSWETVGAFSSTVGLWLAVIALVLVLKQKDEVQTVSEEVDGG